MKRTLTLLIQGFFLGLLFIAAPTHASAAVDKASSEAVVFKNETIEKLIQFCADPYLIEEYRNAMTMPTHVDLKKRFGKHALPLLTCAAITDDQEFIDNVLALKPPIDAPDTEGNTALCYAALSGAHSITIQKLLKAGANAKHTNKKLQTPFMHAALNPQWPLRDDADLLKGYGMLMQAGTDINATDSDGGFALMNAIIFYNAPFVQWAVAQGANVMLKQFGSTPFCVAEENIKTGNHDKMQFLPYLEKIAWLTKIMDILRKRMAQIMGIPFSQTMSPDLPCSIMSREAFNEMADRYEQRDQKAGGERLPSQVDAKTAAMLALNDAQAKLTKLMKVCGGGNEQTALKLLDDPDIIKTINDQDINGARALHHAMLHKTPSLAVVVKLIERGAAVDCRDANGHTPFRYAVHKNHFGIAEYLLTRGADINAYGQQRITALFKAITIASKQQVEWLLKQKNCLLMDHKSIHALALALMCHPAHKLTDYSDRDEDEKTIEKEIIEIIKLVLDATFSQGCHKKRKNFYPLSFKLFETDIARDTILPNFNDELTLPMLIASLHNEFPALMEHLLKQREHIVGINERNKQGKTAMDYAIARNHTQLIGMLKEAGAHDPRIEQAKLEAEQTAQAAAKAQEALDRNNKLLKLQQKRREKEAAKLQKDAQAKQAREEQTRKEATLKLEAAKNKEQEKNQKAEESPAAQPGRAEEPAAQAAASPSPDPRQSPHSELSSPDTIQITIKPAAAAPASAQGASAPAQQPETNLLKVIVQAKNKEAVETLVDPHDATTLKVRVNKKKNSLPQVKENTEKPVELPPLEDIIEYRKVFGDLTKEVSASKHLKAQHPQEFSAMKKKLSQINKDMKKLGILLKQLKHQKAQASIDA